MEISAKEMNGLREGAVLLGKGFLNWDGAERRSDRYGTVVLLSEDSKEPIQTVRTTSVSLLHKIGTLWAVVTTPRESGHIGDLFRGLSPSLPEADEMHKLGHGMLFTELDRWEIGPITQVGVQPPNPAEQTSDWLDPKSLYRLHTSEVELYFTPEKR